MILKDRIAIVTGQSRGLGAAIVRAFRDEGAIVPECTRAELVMDDPFSIETFYGSVMAEYDGIDILVNNAAMLGYVGRLEESDPGTMGKTIAVNLLGPIYLTQKCLPALQRSKRGKIINICGGGASTPLPRRIAYAVSKAGLARFTDSLAAELKNTKIDCNAILPGAMDTGMLDDIIAAGPEKLGKLEYELHASYKQNAPSSPERAAQLCLYLASEESNGLSGKMISARHDPWPFNQEQIKELMRSDKCTLRRIDV